MKIQYENKVSIRTDPSVAEKNKVTDTNMNEIKNVVNTNDDQLEYYKSLVDQIIPTTTGEGTDISLNTIQANMSIDIKGNTTQNTSILPSDYKQVEYIESTGPAYIDTLIKPTTNTKIDISFNTILKGNYGVVFGGEYAYNSNAFHLYDSSGNFDIGFGTRYTATAIAYDINTKYNFVMDKTGLKLNDTTDSFYQNTVSTNNSIFLFAVNRGTSRVIDSNAQKRIYCCKIYDNGTLVRDMIPCYKTSDNTIGMYDLVGKTFYANVGTGTFTKGNDVSIPNPDYPQDINVVSGDNTIVVSNKNIYNSNNVIENALVQFNGSIGTTSECTTIWAKVEPNTTYTLSRDKGDRLVIGGSNSQPVLGASTFIIDDVGTTEVKNYTFNSGNYNYVAIYISRYNTSKPTQIQIEKRKYCNKLYRTPRTNTTYIFRGEKFEFYTIHKWNISNKKWYNI